MKKILVLMVVLTCGLLLTVRVALATSISIIEYNVGYELTPNATGGEYTLSFQEQVIRRALDEAYEMFGLWFGNDDTAMYPNAYEVRLPDVVFSVPETLAPGINSFSLSLANTSDSIFAINHLGGSEVFRADFDLAAESNLVIRKDGDHGDFNVNLVTNLTNFEWTGGTESGLIFDRVKAMGSEDFGAVSATIFKQGLLNSIGQGISIENGGTGWVKLVDETDVGDDPIAAVPESSTILLLMGGLIGLYFGFVSRRRSKIITYQ